MRWADDYASAMDAADAERAREEIARQQAEQAAQSGFKAPDRTPIEVTPRLRFIRWCVETGKITDWPGEQQPLPSRAK